MGSSAVGATPQLSVIKFIWPDLQSGAAKWIPHKSRSCCDDYAKWVARADEANEHIGNFCRLEIAGEYDRALTRLINDLRIEPVIG